MKYYFSAILIFLYQLILLVNSSKRVYVDQFPSGSEHLQFPPTILFHIYMGHMKYPHLPLLLESMRWNPKVQFVLINVIEEGSTDADDIKNLVIKMGVPNFHVEAVTFGGFSARIKDKLGIDVTFTKDWYYKMCDYKPTLAHLFPDIMAKGSYKYWGYGDLDVIWGNFTRFSHWFQGDYPFVISGR